MTTIAATRSLDRRGKTISTFVAFDAAAELGSLATGEVLELITDEYGPVVRDIAVWCEAAGHELVATSPTPDGHRFLIAKGAPIAKDTRLAMVISTDGLEELLSPLSFALAAALEGMHVDLYFQGPAVRVLRRGYQPRLSGWGRPFTRFAAAGMARSGHIAAEAKLRQLRSLGAKIYVCGGSMDHFRVAEDQLIFHDLAIVEYLTFMAVMERADVTLYL